MISFDEFKKMELKTGTVKSVEDIEGADKLYKIIVDTGEERQIVAGIKKDYTKEELTGKQIIIVTNLQPVKLKGVESNGMLLAVEDEKVVLLTVDKPVKNGLKVS